MQLSAAIPGIIVKEIIYPNTPVVRTTVTHPNYSARLQARTYYLDQQFILPLMTDTPNQPGVGPRYRQTRYHSGWG